MELIKHKQIEPLTPSDIPVEVRDKNYVHIQAASDTVWRIKHFLGKAPSINCYDRNGNKIYGDEVPVEGNELNELDIIFCIAVKGTANCN